MKVLDNISEQIAGRQVAATQPLTASVEASITDIAGAHQQVVLFRLSFTNKQIVNDDENMGSAIVEAKKRAAYWFADTLYGEVRDDLRDVLIYAHEHYYDPELSEMIEKIIWKCRGDNHD